MRAPPLDPARPSTRAEPSPDEPRPGTALYVHVPFCAAKCSYCDFYSLAAAGHDLDGLVELLLREARARAPRRPATVFLGGGTPSLLEERLLARLLDGLDEVTDFRSSAAEVTAECNPESLDVAKAAALVSLGVSRLSIGVQTLDRATLELFGRVHDADQALRAYECARSSAARSVNFDVIYGFPGHSPEKWRVELERFASLRPQHLSAYNLTYEPGTELAKWREQGRVQALGEEAELELFELTGELLARHGYERYEISNFSLPGHRCEHNLNYWRNGDYVGLGPSAVSFSGGVRRGNPRSLERWARRVAGGEDAGDWRESLDPLGRLAETWWLGLRLSDGVEPGRARSAARWTDPLDPCERLAAELASEGWLERRAPDAYRLTARALPLADAIARKFLALSPDAPSRAGGPREPLRMGE